MADDKDFQNRVQRISSLVAELDAVVDPAGRAAAKQLLQLVMELHGTGLERIMELTSEAGDTGSHLIDRFGRDALVSSLLVLYGLHPDDVETRVARAVERLQPSLRKQGAELELLSVDATGVRLRVSTTGHACGSTAQTIKGSVEAAMYEAAPDLGTVVVEGLDEKAASSFVSIDKLIGSPVPAAGLIPGDVVHASDGAD